MDYRLVLFRAKCFWSAGRLRTAFEWTYVENKSAAIATTTCHTTAAMPALPADAIDAGLRRRDRQRHNDRRTGTRPERACSATTIRAYRWQNALSLVRRVLRDE